MLWIRICMSQDCDGVTGVTRSSHTEGLCITTFKEMWDGGRAVQGVPRGESSPKGLKNLIFSLMLCNMPHKMEHAGIAHGTTVGLSVPSYQPCYLAHRHPLLWLTRPGRPCSTNPWRKPITVTCWPKMHFRGNIVTSLILCLLLCTL